MSGSDCCFLTCVQKSQEAGKVVWYTHLLKNFPQFVVIHTVKGFNIVNEAEVDAFLEFSCFFDDPVDVGILISGSSAFSKSNLNTWSFSVHTPRLSSVQSLSCVDSLQPRGLQDTGLPCPSPTSGVAQQLSGADLVSLFTLLLLWANKLWQFDLWFLCLF